MEKRVTYDNAIPPGCQCQPGDSLSSGVRITTLFPHKKEGASYLLPKVPGTIMKKCYQK